MEPRPSNKCSTLLLLLFFFFGGQNRLTVFLMFLVISTQSVFVCEHHSGLVRCHTPAAPGTGSWEQQRPESSLSSVPAAQCLHHISTDVFHRGKCIFIYVWHLCEYWLCVCKGWGVFFNPPTVMADRQCFCYSSLHSPFKSLFLHHSWSTHTIPP